MSDGPDKSPSLLQPVPKRDSTGRRMNKRPIWIAAAVIGVVGGAVIYSGYERSQHGAAAMSGGNDTPGPADPASVLAGMHPNVVPAVYKPTLHPVTAAPKLAPRPAAQTPEPKQAQQPPADPDADARKAAWAAYYAAQEQLQKQRLADERAALTADTSLMGTQGASGGPVTPSAPSGGLPPSPALAASGAPGMAGFGSVGGYGGFAGLGDNGPPPVMDVEGQREKQAFANQQGDLGGNDQLDTPLVGPKPDTIMAGTAIPAVMLIGMNSDQPGMVIAQVSRDVRDTATGDYVLIPAGSRLIGRYDNEVSMGQTRIGVIWTRIIFPDTTSKDLGAMEGADQAGIAGFHDQVDTHFWSKLGNAILISIAGAAVQLSQPAPAVSGTYSPTSIASAALGQQFAQLGQEYARAGLSIPNTLEIRPGYRFVVMVNKDLPLPPYVDARSARMPVSFGPVVQ